MRSLLDVLAEANCPPPVEERLLLRLLTTPLAEAAAAPLCASKIPSNRYVRWKLDSLAEVDTKVPEMK